MSTTREACIARNVEWRGVTVEAAGKELDAIVDWHARSGTLPEALWRGGFCRPADSRAVAAQLISERVS